MFKNVLVAFLVLVILCSMLVLSPGNREWKMRANACGGCHNKSVSCHINPDVLKLETMKTIKNLWENTIFHGMEMKEPFDHGAYFSGGCLSCHPDL